MNIKNLHQPLSLFKSVLDSTSDAVFIVDTEGRILYANRTVCDLLQHSPEELMSKRISDLAPNLQKAKWKEYCSEAKSREALGFETIFKCKDGSAALLEIKMAILEMENEEFIALLGRIPNKPKEKDSEHLAECSKQTREIAHELNNLLTAMVSNISMAKIEVATDGEVRSILSDAERVGVDAAKLIKKLSQLANGETVVDRTLSESATRQSETAGTRSRPRPSKSQTKKRILIMDDEQRVLAGTGRMLKHLGFDIELATSGEEAVERYKQATARNQPFDTVLIDLIIPGGMDGKETLKELARFDPDVKAILSSGYLEDTDAAALKHLGFRGIIAKPYKVDELSKVLNEVMDE